MTSDLNTMLSGLYASGNRRCDCQTLALEAKVESILGELGVLTSQLTTSSNDLHRAENEMKLSATMKKLSNFLSAPKSRCTSVAFGDCGELRIIFSVGNL